MIFSLLSIQFKSPVYTFSLSAFSCNAKCTCSGLEIWGKNHHENHFATPSVTALMLHWSFTVWNELSSQHNFVWGPYFANHRKHIQESPSETSRTLSHHPNTVPDRRNKTLFIHINSAGWTVSTWLAKHRDLLQRGYANCNKNRLFFKKFSLVSVDMNRRMANLLCWPFISDHKIIHYFSLS